MKEGRMDGWKEERGREERGIERGQKDGREDGREEEGWRMVYQE